ncbi:MAG: oligosaccharide flippase family protein [Candidatus Omnitrophica bacterium]|nr:oligosaccharide flippase family protein [Candidatus Omnitrophota bacterium]
MLHRFKKLDGFTRNIIIVFAGNSLANFINLLFQLLIAHKLSVTEFAGFNSLLSLFVLISTPFGTLQAPIAKYCAEFNAHDKPEKIGFLLRSFMRRTLVVTLLLFSVLLLVSGSIIRLLKIESASSGYFLAMLVASACIIPVVTGGIQGLEFFGWMTCGSIITGILKLTLAFLLLNFGYRTAGALGAFLASNLLLIFIYYYGLRRYFSAKKAVEFNLKHVMDYLWPVAISYFCFYGLVTMDMLLVKYFYSARDSGLYALAQMVGKIFLFVPAAISMVMFPRISGLNAKNMDTTATLKHSLSYAFVLCFGVTLVFNLFPELILKILTGKVYPESIFLGRLFSLSMSFFALIFIQLNYFLSLKDLRFVKYLAFFTAAQFLAILFFHKYLFQVQLALGVNAVILFSIFFFLLSSKKQLLKERT